MFGLDQLAVFGSAGCTGCHGPLLVGTFVDGQYTAAFGFLTKDAQNTQRVGPDTADHSGGMAVVFGLINGQTAQNTITGTKGRVTGSQHHQNARLWTFAFPFQRTGEKVAVCICGHDLKYSYRGQLFGIAIGTAPLGQLAFFFQLFEQALEINTGGALDTKGLRDVAFGRFGGMLGNPCEDFSF